MQANLINLLKLPVLVFVATFLSVWAAAPQIDLFNPSVLHAAVLSAIAAVIGTLHNLIPIPPTVE